MDYSRLKKCALLLWAALWALPAWSQRDGLFDKGKPLTWLGIDFSHVKYIDPAATVTDQELRDKYFVAWNQLVAQEPKKYDLGRAFGRTIIDRAEVAEKANAKARPPFVLSRAEEASGITEADLGKIAKSYDLSGLEGIGAALVAESLDKPHEKGHYWLVFLELPKGSVLLAQKMSGPAAGFGFRNYWAGSYYKVLKSLPDALKKWEKEQGR